MSALGPREHAEIRRFRAALTLDPGVSFHVIVADTRRVLDEALAEIGVEVERVRPLALARVDVHAHAHAILRAFEGALDHARGRAVVLDAIVSTPATDHAWRRVFAGLNETRNLIEQRASGPLVFAVSAPLEQALGHEAPDLWSKRGSGMRLCDRTPNRVFLSYAVDSPEVAADVEELAEALADARLSVDRARWTTVDAADDLESLAEEDLRRVDVVVCVCTPLYRARVDGEAPVGSGHAATWEARAVRHDAQALGPQSDHFVRVRLPTIELAIPFALGASPTVRHWPEDRARLLDAASAPTVHARVRRGLQRAFGDDTAAMERWASDFVTLWASSEAHEPRAHRIVDRLLRVRDPDARRRALASLGDLQRDRATVDAIAVVLGLGDLPTTKTRRSPIPPSPSPLSNAEVGRYLDAVVSRSQANPIVATTDELYVPLDGFVRAKGSRSLQVSAELGVVAAEAEVVEHRVERRSIPLLRAFEHAREHGRRGLVLLGDPGAGKSTVLAQVLLEVAREGAEAIGLPSGTVPVLLRLSELRPEVEDLGDFVEQELGKHWGLPKLGERLWEYGRLLLLLDGLDEVADGELRVRVSRWIERTRRSAPGTYFLVSSRYGGYTPDVELDAAVVELHIPPLDDARARRFVTRWCSDRRLDERATAELLEAISRWRADEPQLHALTRSPLALTMICEAYLVHGALLQRRVELYEACVSTRLGGHPLAAELRVVLEHVAWWMHTEERTQATVAELEPVIGSAFARTGLGLEPRAWLRSIRDEHGLLLGWGIDDYGFVHLAIQEYLAAQRMRVLVHDDPSTLAALAHRLGTSWWKEVVALVAEGGDREAAAHVAGLVKPS